METKITVIIDNKKNKNNGLSSQWGLSLLIEYSGKKILLDTGGSDLFIKNMKKLGMDVADVDYAVLSHAHCDHANGMPAFFKNNSKAKFYLREGTSDNCYGKIGFLHFYAGIPRGIISEYHDRIVMASGDYTIMEGVYLIPHKTAGLSLIGKKGGMYRRTPNGFIPDDFSHEQSLVIDTSKGLVILNSCSHGGVINIVNEVRETFPDKHIYALIGGFHLFTKPASEIHDIAQTLDSMGIDLICTGHCTKERAYGIMKKDLGDKLMQMRVGLSIVI